MYKSCEAIQTPSLDSQVASKNCIIAPARSVATEEAVIASRVILDWNLEFLRLCFVALCSPVVSFFRKKAVNYTAVNVMHFHITFYAITYYYILQFNSFELGLKSWSERIIVKLYHNTNYNITERLLCFCKSKQTKWQTGYGSLTGKKFVSFL